MECPDFKKFNMTKIEEKIYCELAKLKSSKMGEIIKKTGLHRGTVYNSLNNLIKKGMVSFVDKEGTRFYKICGESVFDDILEEKKRDLMLEKTKIKSFFDEIKNINKFSENEEINVFYGITQFKSLFLNIYNYCKKNKDEYLFLGAGGNMQQATGITFYRYTQMLKKKMKIKCRVILDRESINLDYHRYVSGNLRYLKSKVKSPVNFWIYGNYVLLVLFGSCPLISINIKSKVLADAFKNYFEDLWKIAKPENRV